MDTIRRDLCCVPITRSSYLCICSLGLCSLLHQWWAIPALFHSPCPLALSSLVIYPVSPFSDSHIRTWLWWLIILLSPTLSSPSISSGSSHKACKCCNFFQYLENLPLIPEASLSDAPFSSSFRTQSRRSLLGSLYQLTLVSVFPRLPHPPLHCVCS